MSVRRGWPLLQEPFGTAVGLSIHGVNEFHPHGVDVAAADDLAFLEARSVIARMTLCRVISARTPTLAQALAWAPLWPRHVGKATLALEGAHTGPMACLDLESSENKAADFRSC